MRRLTKSLKYVTALVLLAPLACGSCFGQESLLMSPPATGTLNLLLANRRGFVIAADSRRTQLFPRMHWDDSQKLFRAGPKSALVIAGFATWASQGSPIDVQVASVFREEFADHEWTSGKRLVTDMPGLIRTSVGYELQLFGALLATATPAPPADSLDFQALAAGINKAGKVQIVRFAFRPRVKLWGPFNLAIPSYDMNFTTTVVDHFVGLSAGADTVARAILDGTVETQDSRILNYYRSRSARQLDELSLVAMEGLAIAILAETKRATSYVGGPDQIGVFSRGGSVEWILPQLPTDRQKLRSTILHVGFTYTPDGFTPQEYSEAKGKNMFTAMSISLSQPFEQPFTQVFVGARFRDVSVALDGNVFAGNRFSNVTFKYQGGLFFFGNNTIDSCVLESPPNVIVPSVLGSCTPKQRLSVALDGTIGSPIRAQPKGCVTRNADGRLMIKTKGRQNGQDCKGSRVVVPFYPLGPRPTKQP